MGNARTFSMGSENYARYRPSYPEDLFSFLNDLSERHESAWDCATGNGQAAISCAKYFSRVEATDISPEQIRHCITHPKVRYSVSSAENAPFDANSFDLIVVAQALHWFDQEQFFREVKRVLKPKGVLAIFGYGFIETEPEMDKVIYENLLAPIDGFWSAGNRLLMTGYRGATLPYNEIAIQQQFVVKVDWNFQQLLEYLRTWSAVKLFIAELKHDPVAELALKLKSIWMEPDNPRNMTMPLFLRICRKPSYKCKA